jgi:shikimate kinase
MYLSLIGMAGSGKSYWSIKLAEFGFYRFCCDDLIEEKLAPELRQAEGTSMGLAEWMGFPYEPQYKTRESRYLTYEIEVLNEILGHLENREANSEEKIVIDTTGSVIYTGQEVLRKLSRSTTVVHLSTPPQVKERMLQVYVAQPRPVLWRDLFDKKPDETNDEALARCYPELLSTRERLYRQYADVSIDYHKRNKENFAVHDFLREIQAAIGEQGE